MNVNSTKNETISRRTLIDLSPTRFQRILIVFGSICLIWLILGLVFGSMESFRRWKRRSKMEIRLGRSTAHFPSVEQIEEENDDQQSVLTSFSFVSDRSHRQNDENFDQIPASDIRPDFAGEVVFENLAFSCSTLNSSSIRFPMRKLNSQSSINTVLSQMTQATFLTSNSRAGEKLQKKLLLLPTVMVTDCDRLQTDIIDLDEFQPEKQNKTFQNGELRRFLNQRNEKNSR